MSDMSFTAELVKDFSNLPLTEVDIQEILKGVIALADLNDIVVTVEQVSNNPPAMGNYTTMISTRKKIVKTSV